MIRKLLTLAVVVWGAIALTQPASAAGKRVALVLGNSAYQNVAKLPNPSRDASAIAKLLKDAGFEVIEQTDVGNLEFKRAIRRFGDALSDAEVAVVFYAGHGIEVRGVNYLIPVDAKLASDRDAEDEAVSLDRLVQEIEESGGQKQLRLIILDACRDNPFVRTMKVARAGQSRSRSTGGVGGLGAIQPTGSDMLIAYAAKQGSTAEDGVGDHSPFTQALLRNLTVPGLDIRLAFGRIRDDVLKTTNNQQEPFVYGSLGGGVVSLVPAAVSAQSSDNNAAKADYDLVAKIGTKKAFEVFLGTYKSGFYADLARAQVDELTKREQLASRGPVNLPSSSAGSNTEEGRAWSRLENSTDINELQKFIARYPTSTQAIRARDRISMLERNAKERELDRQRAKLAAEQEEATKRVEAERRAKAAADSERQRLEREAALKREEDARRAATARTDAERQALLAAARRAEDALRAKQAELDRLRAEREAALKREEELQRAKQAELAAQLRRAEDERRAWLDAERRKSEQLAALQPSRQESKPDSKPAPAANTPQLVTAAQKQLVRLGCYDGRADGNLNEATKSALRRYHLQKHQIVKEVSVTDGVLSDLETQKGRVCPLLCRDGFEAKGDICVAKAKPSKRDEDLASRRRHEREKQQAKSRPSRPEPQSRREASSAPAPAPRAHGGGGSISGVGF